MDLRETDLISFINENDTGNSIISLDTQRKDLSKCPHREAIMAGVDYICSIRKAMCEQNLNQEKIDFLEEEISTTKQNIMKCL